MNVVGRDGKSLQEYLDRLTQHPLTKKSKLVPCAKDESWCGDWTVDGQPCFLALLKEEFDFAWKPKEGRKGKKIRSMEPTGCYYIWCCGNDDLAMAKRGMELDEAMKLFYLITIDGTSRKDLSDFGFSYD